eukprot:3629708-Rhodomonas_salina.2
MSTTPKKQLFLSGASGKFPKASLDLSPVAKSDGSPPAEAKASWESPGADEESDPFGSLEVPAVGTKRKAGVSIGSVASSFSTLGPTGNFSSRIGQQLERLVSDMGKKKRQKVYDYYELEQNKIRNEVKVFVEEVKTAPLSSLLCAWLLEILTASLGRTQTNESVAKVHEQHSSETKRIHHARAELQNARIAKHKDVKQRVIKTYHSGKELVCAWEGLKERQQRRRQELVAKAKERAKRLRANCSTELKKIESSLSSEKAIQNEDMMQLKTLIGQLFTD